MSFDVLALLFIAFSVISSLANKWQERRREAEREQQSPQQRVPVPEPEIDLSEWDVLREPAPVERDPDPEFIEVRGHRRISEADDGTTEFQEVRGFRPVDESDSGPEFSDPLSKQDEVEAPSRDSKKETVESMTAGLRTKRSRARKLRFDKNALINGILYQEILGPPKSERMQ
jgi:hypothetical protein